MLLFSDCFQTPKSKIVNIYLKMPKTELVFGLFELLAVSNKNVDDFSVLSEVFIFKVSH